MNGEPIMPSFSEEQLRGASSLLRDGLRLTEGTSVLMLYQSEFTDAAQCIRGVAQTRGIVVEERLFNREDFFDSYPSAFSPSQLLLSNPIPVGIVLLMEWSEETTGARLSLLKHLQQAGTKWRIASMPGVQLKDFASCYADLGTIEDLSNMVFAVLARGHVAVLETQNPSGQLDVLKIPLGLHCPIISSGRINDGSWGNFPSGETFIVPNEHSASGTVTVRGSFPNYVLRANDWIRFSLRRGRILFSSLEGSSEEVRRRFADLFFRASGSVKSRNANALAELGVGTNDAIFALTGNPIFDEKKLGTVHIAFGRNDQFSGSLTGSPHHDVTCTGATLRVSNVKVLESGRFCLTWTDAKPSLESTPPPRVKLAGRFKSTGTPSVAFKTGGIEPASLSVTYAPCRGDQVSFILGHGKVAEDAMRILALLQEGGAMSLLHLSRTLGRDYAEVHDLISGLLAYNLIEKCHSVERDH